MLGMLHTLSNSIVLSLIYEVYFVENYSVQISSLLLSYIYISGPMLPIRLQNLDFTFLNNRL